MRRIQVFSVLCSIFLLAGCGGGVEELKLEPVTGTLSVDGAPGEGIAVSFSPVEGKGQGAIGVADATGKYELKFRDGRMGVPAGSYKVTYSKIAMPDGSPIPDDVDSPSEVGAIDVIPEKFRDLEKIEKTETVPEGGTTIDLSISLK